MSQERSIVTCKVCKVIKARILYKKIGKEKIWVDEDEGKWNGLTCPDCHRNNVKINVRIKRAQKV